MKIYNLPLLLCLLFSFSFEKARLVPQLSAFPVSPQQKNKTKPPAKNIVFKSSYGGENWQDMSAGLFETGEEINLETNCFFAIEGGHYLRAGGALYRSTINSSAPFWNKEIISAEVSKIWPGKRGMYTYNREGKLLYMKSGSKAWLPISTNFRVYNLRTVFQTTGGSLFIGTDDGLFRSADAGKTWKQVYHDGWLIKIVESNGTLMATSQGGILRSTDDGLQWDNVLREGGVGIDIQAIRGGFAAINYNTKSEVRRVRTSYDGGKTWPYIDAVLPGDSRTSTIIQVGESFLCGHPNGIYKTSDHGKTWMLLVQSAGDKVFNLFVSGDVIYAIALSGGC
jgi:hypothetical protein